MMTGFNTCFSLLKVKVDIPYLKVIDYVNHFSHYRKTVSLICSLCLCVMVIPYTGSTRIQRTSVFSGHPCLIWCAVTQNQALTTL